MKNKLAAALAGAALIVSPTVAMAASNPAASLSLARAGSDAGHVSRLTGLGTGTIAAVIIGIGIAVIVAIEVNDQENDNPRSP